MSDTRYDFNIQAERKRGDEIAHLLHAGQKVTAARDIAARGEHYASKGGELTILRVYTEFGTTVLDIVDRYADRLSGIYAGAVNPS